MDSIHLLSLLASSTKNSMVTMRFHFYGLVLPQRLAWGMQNCHQQRKGFAEPEAIDFPRVRNTAVPSASTRYDSYSQRNSSVTEMPGVLTRLHVGPIIGHEATGYLTTRRSARRVLLFLLFCFSSCPFSCWEKKKSHHLSSGFSL